MARKPLYKVVVRHNIVCAIQRLEDADRVDVPQTKLEVSTQLAKNNQENGCIDGDYYFEDANLAKNFAILSLDFAKRLIEKTLAQIEDRSFTGEFDWRNPHQPRD
ncbi:MAG: hypothetical protein ACE5LB_04120 [Acidiferrobacterales bacterium]